MQPWSDAPPPTPPPQPWRPAAPGWAPPPGPPAPPPSWGAGPAAGWGGPDRSPPPPERPTRAWWAGIGVAAVVAFVASFVVFAVLGPALDTLSSPRVGGYVVPAPSYPSAPTGPSAPSGGTGSSGAASMPDVAAAVNPGIVYVQSLMGQGLGVGTGMILSAEGRVLTNNHVIDGASLIRVRVVATGDTYDARVVGAEPREDVAVLQLEGASDLTPIPLGDSDQVKIGDRVAAIGNAGGQGGDPVVATGTVVALGAQVTASDEYGGGSETLTDMIQVRANVQPGDSGGPLASADGKVVGMTTAASAGPSRSRGRTTGGGEGFAIPINRALSVADRVAASGQGSSGSGSSTRSNRAILGVEVQAGAGGVEIRSVVKGGAAERAGLRAGDVILEVDGSPVEVPGDLTGAIGSHRPGDTVTVTWSSGGQQRRAEVVLGASR